VDVLVAALRVENFEQKERYGAVDSEGDQGDSQQELMPNGKFGHLFL